MDNLLSNQSWAEFVLQAFMSHWFIAILLVSLVAIFIGFSKTLNATTRHNIWLITLVSFLLMPLLVFLPKPEINLPSFSVVSTPDVQIRTTPAFTDASPLVAPRETGVANENLVPVVREATGIPQNENIIAVDANNSVLTPVTTKQISLTSLLKGILVFWLVGAAYLVRRLWGEYRAARELELQSDSVTPYFERRFTQLCERLGIKERPLLRFHVGINAPMTVGLYRVWVAIPMVWREEIDDDIFDQTLTHELGHIARKDPLVHTIQRLMNIIFWMYPAFWYVARQLELERESACDDWVLTHDGKGHTYANNLLNVAESLYLQPHVLAVGCLRSHSQLSRRIQNLLNKSSDHAIRNSKKLLLGVTTAVFLTLSVSAVIWPDANEYLAGQTAEEADASGAVAKLGDEFLGLDSDDKKSGAMLVMNGVEIDKETAKPVHNPMPNPIPIPNARPVPPVPPQVVVNNGDGTHSYSYSDNGNYSELVQSDKYGKGSISMERKNGAVKNIKLKPAIKKNKQPLLYAAWNKDWLSIKRLLKDGEDVNTVFKRPTLPRTALNAAILQGDLDMVEFLVEAGAEVTGETIKWSRDHDKVVNPLTVAAMSARKSIAKYLLKNGAEEDDSTMGIAVHSKNVELVEFLIDQGLQLKDELLVIAIQNRDTEMVDMLLDNDIKVDDAAVIVAIQNRDTQVVKRLVKEADDIDSSALIVAIQNRDDEMVDFLLDAGVEPEDSALVIAVQNRNRSVVKRLLDAGADIDESALIMAVQNRDDEMVDWLLDAGVEPEEGSLVIAIQNRNKKMVKRLLKAGADIDEGALIIAIQNQDTDMVRWLIKSGAPVDDGALIVAMQSKNKEIIALVQKEYRSENGSLSEYESLDYLGSLKSLDSLENMERLDEKFGEEWGEKFGEEFAEKWGEKFGLEVANGVVNFLGDMTSNGGNFESLALVKALENNDSKLAFDLLDDGAIPNTLNITQALENSNEKLVRELLKYGAKPNALNILQALENREFDLAQELMHKGAKPNGLVLLKAMETEHKKTINVVRSYLKDNRAEVKQDIDQQEDQVAEQFVSQKINQALNRNEEYFNKVSSSQKYSEHDEKTCPHEHPGKEIKANFSIEQWPVETQKISFAFGDNASQYNGKRDAVHKGLDFPISKNSEIKSVAAGLVIEAGFTKNYGNYIVINHGNGFLTEYASNEVNLVQKGQRVSEGEVIGKVGQSAKNATGPHLHFGLRYNGHVQDPLPYLKNSNKSRT